MKNNVFRISCMKLRYFTTVDEKNRHRRFFNSKILLGLW